MNHQFDRIPKLGLILPSSFTRRPLLAALFVGTGALSSCNPEGEQLPTDSNISSSGQGCGGAFVLPDPEGTFFQTVTNVPNGGAPVYDLTTPDKVIAYVGSGEIQVPLHLLKGQAEKNGRAPFEIRGYASAGKKGFIDSEFVEKRVVEITEPPCEENTPQDAIDSIGAYSNPTTQFYQSIAMCAVGIGEGSIQSASGLLAGIQGLLKISADAIWTVIKRDADIILAIGSQSARARLAEAGIKDEERLKAAFALIQNAIPTIDAYLKAYYEAYSKLNPVQQSREACKILGKIAFATLTAASAAKTAELFNQTKGAAAVDQVIKKTSKMQKSSAPITKLTSTVSPANYSAAGIKTFVNDIMVRCHISAHACLGLPANASREAMQKRLDQFLYSLSNNNLTANGVHAEDLRKLTNAAHSTLKRAGRQLNLRY